MENNFVDQLDFLNKLNAIIDTKAKEMANLPVVDPYESQSATDIAQALSKSQGEFSGVKTNQINPYFKTEYANLDALEQALRPVLAKHGLSYTQQTKITPDGITLLSTKLRHGNEWIESRARIVPPKNDVQTYGSYVAFMKRDQLSNLLGVSWGHEDDDGERAMFDQREVKSKGVALNVKYNPKENTQETIGQDQLEELEYELTEYPDVAEMVLDGLKLQSLADMPKSKYMVALQRIREIKRLRNEGIPAK
jgi:hypothetical protein